MAIYMGSICEIVNATVKKNNGVRVIVVGNAGSRYIEDYGVTQCYFIDRSLETRNGKRRNWTTEKQLKPIENNHDQELDNEESLISLKET